MLSVVTWRWGTHYGVDHINRLQSMLARHLHIPHRLYCITDDPDGLDECITAIPIWPANGLGRARRLRIFDPSVRGLFGDRILQLDIDCIIVDDITPLVDRSEPFVIWRSVPELKYVGGDRTMKPNGENGIGAYNTSMVLMDTGVFPTLWRDYLSDSVKLEAAARKAGTWTMIQKTYEDAVTSIRPLAPGDDDQAIISLYARRLDPLPPTWLEADGVYKYGRRGFADTSKLPANAKIVFFNGSIPDNARCFEQSELVAEHWR